MAPGDPPAACTAAALGVGKIEVLSGDGQRGVALQPFAPIVVRATDADGNRIAGVALTVTPQADSGTVSASTLSAGADGMASFTWTPPAETEGAKAVLVESPGLFTAKVHGSSVFGHPVSLAIDTPFLLVGARLPLSATPRDASGAVVGAGRVVWGTTDPSMLSVFPDGTASALKAGAATLTAGVAGLSATKTVPIGLVAGGNLTPQLDGRFSPSEWAYAGSVAVEVDPATLGTFYFAFNSGTMYFALRFPQPQADLAGVFVEFDQNGSGVLDAGDAAFEFDPGEAVRDWVVQCDGPESACLVPAAVQRFGGGFAGNDGTNTTVEFAHPFRTGGPSEIAVPSGGAIGVRLKFRMWTSDHSTIVETIYPASGLLLVRY